MKKNFFVVAILALFIITAGALAAPAIMINGETVFVKRLNAGGKMEGVIGAKLVHNTFTKDWERQINPYDETPSPDTSHPAFAYVAGLKLPARSGEDWEPMYQQFYDQAGNIVPLGRLSAIARTVKIAAADATPPTPPPPVDTSYQQIKPRTKVAAAPAKVELPTPPAPARIQPPVATTSAEVWKEIGALNTKLAALESRLAGVAREVKKKSVPAGVTSGQFNKLAKTVSSIEARLDALEKLAKAEPKIPNGIENRLNALEVAPKPEKGASPLLWFIAVIALLSGIAAIIAAAVLIRRTQRQPPNHRRAG
ncbi:MAG: hypothetical protein Q8O93_01635 [bacterium]|nr:hypothetical protein [bacterium]